MKLFLKSYGLQYDNDDLIKALIYFLPLHVMTITVILFIVIISMIKLI